MESTPEKCNAPFAAFSNCRLPKGHTGHHAHAILRLPENAENPPPEGRENEELLAKDRALYGVCFTDVTGKRIDPEEITPYT